MSLLLPRYDGYGHGMGIVNSEIIKLLGHISNIFLISHDNIDESHFIHDGLHLSPEIGFEIMAANWLEKLGRISTPLSQKQFKCWSWALFKISLNIKTTFDGF